MKTAIVIAIFCVVVDHISSAPYDSDDAVNVDGRTRRRYRGPIDSEGHSLTGSGQTTFTVERNAKCDESAWNERFRPLEDNLRDVGDDRHHSFGVKSRGFSGRNTDQRFSSNPGPDPVVNVNCQRDSVTIANENTQNFPRVRNTTTTTTFNRDIYNSESRRTSGSAGSEDIARHFLGFNRGV